MQGTSENPDLIPHSLAYLFGSLKDKLEESIYKFKPDKFNGICSLKEAEFNKELEYKKQLLSLSGNNTPPTFSEGELTNPTPANKKYAIWLSFYVLYNDAVYYLLTIPKENKLTSIPNERPKLHIEEDGKRIPYIKVFSKDEHIKVLEYGQKNRQSHSNIINANSSRSHAVFSRIYWRLQSGAGNLSLT